MPIPTSKNQPVAPHVEPATLEALVKESANFLALAPWTWMHDSQLLGVALPTGQGLGICSVLGRLKEVFGLLVYRRAAGHRWVLDAAFGGPPPDDPDEEDHGLEQDFLQVDFVLKKDLHKDDRKVLATCGYSPAKQLGAVWPIFRSLVPGGFPWHPTQEEANALLHTLPRVGAFARLMRRRPDLYDPHFVGEIPIFPERAWPADAELQPSDLDWRPAVRPPEEPPEEVVLDEATEVKLAALPGAKALHLEFDLFYMPFPVADGKVPYIPKATMAVEPSSGLIAGMTMGPSRGPECAKTMGEVFTRALLQLGRRPGKLHVQRRIVQQMISSVAQRLQITVVVEQELSALNSARDAVTHSFPQ